MDILFAAGHLPDSHGRQAGARHSFHMCEALAERHRVHLLAFATKSELEHLKNENLSIFASRHIIPVTNSDRLKGIFSAPRLPLAIGARTSRKFKQSLQDFLRTVQIDIAVFDHTSMFQYAELISDTVVKVGNAHDVMTQSWSRKSQASKGVLRFLIQAEQRRLQQFEAKAFNDLDYVVVLSDKDKELVEEIQPTANPIVVHLWMSQMAIGQRQARESANLMFWGAMDRQENVDAVRWIAREMLPTIRQSIPNVKFYIAGNRGESLAAEFAGRDDVVVTGFIQDVAEMMSKMDVALLPLRLGAGVKVKVLECMSAGLPVVTTEVGAEGIEAENGREYLVGRDANEIVSLTIRLLRNPSEAQKIGNAGRKFIEDHHNFPLRMKQAEELLEQAVTTRRSQQSVADAETGVGHSMR